MSKKKKNIIFERLVQFFISLALLFILLIIYLGVQRIVTPTYSFMIPADYMVPFLDWTIIIYVSYYFFFLVASLLINRKTFIKFILVMFIAYVFSIIMFVLFPSSYPRFDYTQIKNEVFQWAYGALHGVDKANNTFPSLHVSLTWIGCIGLIKSLKRFRWLVFIYGLLITISVLTTKQHYIADIFGGVSVAFLSYYFYNIIERDFFKKA